MNNLKFDFNDISIIPTMLSDISSRDEINVYDKNNKLPLWVSPMDTVVSKDNHKLFLDLGYNVCLPRGEKYSEDKCFISYGLDEIIKRVENNEKLSSLINIDIANGNMIKLYNISKVIKEKYDVQLMVGNIANPKTYEKLSEIGVDYIRCGIGGGSICTTAANVGIFYPMASLIKECYDISCTLNNSAKIIADGGFKNFDEIIKALAIGADGVMLGGILSKCIESCAPCYMKDDYQGYKEISYKKGINIFKNKDEDLYKQYRGSSIKSVQKKWNKNKIKTGEGIIKFNEVEYTLQGWTENFIDYLKSNMSYCGKRNLEEYIGYPEYVFISQNSFKRFYK